MSGRLEGKKILVTAAGQGIGKATAIAFHKEGAQVTATDLNDKTLADLNKEYPDIKVQKLDSTDNSAILEFTKTLEKVDVLFNAVGFVHHGTILECEEKDWDFSSTVNVKSMYFMCKAILPLMVKQNGGSIINVSSCASSLKGFPNRFVYGATKGAVIGLTKSLGKELAENNIAVNCVTPAAAKTRIFDQMTEEHINYMLSKIPRNKFAKVEELASLVTWLASEENSFSTAAVFDLSGGRATY